MFLKPDGTTVGECSGDAPVLIGRGEDASIRLDDRTVSRNHARVTLVGGRFRLADLDSAAGVEVNGMTVSQVVSFLEAQGKAPTSPRQAEGLAQIRQSVHFFLRAAFYMLGQASFDERLRFPLLDALGQTAAIYAASMIPEAKTGLRDLAETTLRTAPVHFRLDLRKFIDAMGGNTCNAICKA